MRSNNKVGQEIEGVTITYSDKYKPNYGYKPLLLSDPEFRTVLKNFSSGELSMSATARSLISMLFKRDFSPSGSHWSYNGASARLIKTHDSGAESYDCEETADWDWKDINAQAKSDAIITLSADRKRIRLDNYSYCCAG